jgi:hypothetical protein
VNQPKIKFPEQSTNTQGESVNSGTVCDGNQGIKEKFGTYNNSALISKTKIFNVATIFEFHDQPIIDITILQCRINGKSNAKEIWRAVNKFIGHQRQETGEAAGITAHSLNLHYADVSRDREY